MLRWNYLIVKNSRFSCHRRPEWIKICYFVFLHNDKSNISLIRSEEQSSVKYTYNKTEYSLSYIIDKEYYLVISEKYKDTETYLYKSTNIIGSTDVKVPEFIIKPGLTINFTHVYYNLSELEYLKYNNNALSRQISDCKHYKNNSIMSCEIKYNYF